MTRRATLAAMIAAALAGLVLQPGTAFAQGAPLQLGPPAGAPAAPAAPANGATANPGGAPRVAPVPPTRPSTDSPTAPAVAQPADVGAPAIPPALQPADANPASLAAPLRRAAPRTARGIDASARDVAQQVNAYFNAIRYMQGDFVQIGPDGRRTTGKLYLDKPGKIRFQYSAPSPVEIIADGQSVAIRDRRLNTQDIYSLSQTPLRFLLSDRIDILRDANVTSVTRDPEFVIVMLEEKQAIGGTNRLMVLFNASDLRLRQWTIFDAQGYETSVALHNLDTTRRPDARLFRINYERILQ